MAQQKDIQKRKRELISEIATLRTDIGTHRSEFVKRLNPAKRISMGLQKRPLHIFGLTFLATGLLTLLLRKKPKPSKTVKSKITAKGILASTLFSMTQPFVKKWLIHILRQKYGARFGDHINLTSRDSLLGP